jgi:hypothetical protein
LEFLRHEQAFGCSVFLWFSMRIVYASASTSAVCILSISRDLGANLPSAGM